MEHAPDPRKSLSEADRSSRAAGAPCFIYLADVRRHGMKRITLIAIVAVIAIVLIALRRGPPEEFEPVDRID